MLWLILVKGTQTVWSVSNSFKQRKIIPSYLEKLIDWKNADMIERDMKKNNVLMRVSKYHFTK